LKELHKNFFTNYFAKMTAFWNFIALGHSPQLLLQKKDYSNVLPGFRLFVMEPAAAAKKGLPSIPGAADVRFHLSQLFIRNSLPF